LDDPELDSDLFLNLVNFRRGPIWQKARNKQDRVAMGVQSESEGKWLMGFRGLTRRKQVDSEYVNTDMGHHGLAKRLTIVDLVGIGNFLNFKLKFLFVICFGVIVPLCFVSLSFIIVLGQCLVVKICCSGYHLESLIVLIFNTFLIVSLFLFCLIIDSQCLVISFQLFSFSYVSN